MYFRALGPLAVEGADSAGLTRPARRRLLSLLLLEAGREVPSDVLIDRMWGESPPQTARNSIQVQVFGLRRGLVDRIITTSNGYILSLAHGDRFDVADFESHALKAARRLAQGRPREASDSAEKARDLWRGTPFSELEDVEAADGERARLIELHTATVTNHIKALTLQGRVSESIAHLRESVLEHPLNEAFWEELVLAYHLSGRSEDAVAAFDEANRTLGMKLGIIPGPRLRELGEKVQSRTRTGHQFSATPHNLPGVDASFVGRAAEVEEIRRALAEIGTVTLTGDPGVGKTRLAIEIGRSLLSGYPGGVRLVRLRETRTEREVRDAIGAALEDHDFADPILLILDGCEHVAEYTCAVLTDFPKGVPLRILATSHTGLGVDGEVEWSVGPLGLPDSVEDLYVSETMRLLVDRVGAMDPILDLGSLDPDELFVLCQRTGGVPRVIEQAARWVPSLDISNVVDLISESA